MSQIIESNDTFSNSDEKEIYYIDQNGFSRTFNGFSHNPRKVIIEDHLSMVDPTINMKEKDREKFRNALNAMNELRKDYDIQIFMNGHLI